MAERLLELHQVPMIKRLQQISPQYTPGQLKAVLAAAPNLRKAVANHVGRQELKSRLEHETQRLKVALARGDEKPQQPSNKPVWKPPAMAKPKQKLAPVARTFALLPGQGGDSAGVASASSLQDALNAVKRTGGATAAARALVSPKSYDLGEVLTKEVVLRFAVTEEGEHPQQFEADVKVFLYNLSADELEIRSRSEAMEIHTAPTLIARLKLVHSFLQQDGVWVPIRGSAKEILEYLKAQHTAVAERRMGCPWRQQEWLHACQGQGTVLLGSPRKGAEGQDHSAAL
eukprot:5936392-Amphidinium_carterae.2